MNDFERFIELFSSVVWEIDPHYKKFQSRCIILPKVIIDTLFNFNNPKAHKHKVKNIDSKELSNKIRKLEDFSARQYMTSPHMAGFRSLIEEFCEQVQAYLDYLHNQTGRNKRVRSSQGPSETTIDEFSSTQIKMEISDDESAINTFRMLKDALFEASVYSPLEISDHIERNNRQ